ncbi:hypothetical protein HMPREF9996_00392 [Aggregatibacter actinomycetemcomitans Y4]|nr:hypothetical protein HMPREF9996_00392 [Aggregatibacter actinomycetemcomitans Y4]
MNETWLRHKNPWEKSDKSAVYFSGILRGIVGIICLDVLTYRHNKSLQNAVLLLEF